MIISKNIALVQVYIHHMTGKEVQIDRPFGANELIKLKVAAAKTAEWINRNNITITAL